MARSIPLFASLGAAVGLLTGTAVGVYIDTADDRSLDRLADASIACDEPLDGYFSYDKTVFVHDPKLLDCLAEELGLPEESRERILTTSADYETHVLVHDGLQWEWSYSSGDDKPLRLSIDVYTH